MLHTHAVRSCEKADSRPAARRRDSEHELYPRHAGAAIEVLPADNASGNRSPSSLARGREAVRPLVIGNQAMLRMIHRESVRSGPDQATPSGQVIRRKCSCGGGDHECEACKQKREEKLLQRKPGGGTNPGRVPGIVHQVLRSAGQPLPASARDMFESRFGRSFDSVRIHTGPRAAQSARSIDAQAYAAGNNIVFGEGSYAPHSPAGQHLLAHELAHIAQQGGIAHESTGSLRVGGVHDPAEQDADRMADSVMRGNSVQPSPAAPALRRKVVVSPASATPQIASHFDFICPGKFTASGPNITGTCDSNTSAGCECLCDVVNDAARTYTFNVADAVAGTAPDTMFDKSTVTVPTTSVFPTTHGGPNPTIEMPSTASSVEFGSFNPSSRGVWAPLWRVLAHELCGHARLNQSYKGVTGDREGHDSTIKTENQIAAEHGEPPRGLFAEKLRHGESFFNPVGDRSKVFFFLKDGKHLEAP